MIRRRIEAVAWVVGVIALAYWRVSALPYVAKQVAMGVLAAVVVFLWVAYATRHAIRLWKTPLPREAPALDAVYWVCDECGWRTELFSSRMVAQRKLHPLDVATWGPRV